MAAQPWAMCVGHSKVGNLSVKVHQINKKNDFFLNIFGL